MPLGREESVYSLPGQNMSQLPLFWGPDLLGYRDGGVHGGRELEPGSPAVIYGGDRGYQEEKRENQKRIEQASQ